MLNIQKIDPDAITVGARLRPLNPARVDELADSIAKFGLQTPISVWCPNDTDAFLVAGHHRLAAVRKLGLWEIECAVVEMDECDRRLWEIAENLHRSELTVQERADHVAEWVRLTDEKVKGGQVAHPGGQQPHEAGVSKAAKDLGIDRRQARRSVKIASITDDAKAAAKAAGLDNNQSALLEVANADPGDQTAKVAELKRRREAREIVKKSGDAIVKHDGNDEAAQIIIDYIPADVRQGLMLHLDAGGHHKLTAAIRRALTSGGRVGAARSVFDSTRAGAMT